MEVDQQAATNTNQAQQEPGNKEAPAPDSQQAQAVPTPQAPIQGSTNNPPGTTSQNQ